MNHQSVVEAAVQAAARMGTQATVIILGDGNGATASMPVSAEAPTYEAPPMPPTPGAPASHTSGEVAAAIQVAEARVAELTAALTQRDQAITTLQTAAAAPGNGAAQPTDVVSIDTYDIDVLGIGEAANVAKLKKAGYTTIGQIRQGFANLKDLKLKGGQKAVIDVAERLMGKVPAERVAAAAAPAASAGGAADIPAGHQDRPWLERLGATKAKERDQREYAAKIAAVKAEHPDENNMPDVAYDQLLDAQREHDIAKSQVVALVWTLGLDKAGLGGETGGGSVDACLAAAGLTHLCDEPAPRVVPAPVAG